MSSQGSASLSFQPYPLKRRSDLHLARKLWHCLGVLFIVGVYTSVSADTGLRLMAVVSFICVMIDISRQQWPKMNFWTLKIFGSVMREHERDSIAGTTYLLLGTFLIIWFFPRPIVTLSLIFLAVADPLASYVGILYGRDKLIGSKSLQGTLAAFAACTIVALGYLWYSGLMTERLLMVSLLAGISGALAELLPIGRLDDNFTFPIVSALCLWGIFTVFGGLI